MLWKITPLFAQWISSPSNILWDSSILHPDSTAIELGCGVAGVLALSLGPSIGQYIATDQDYVRKVFQENIEENYQTAHKPAKHRHQHRNPRSVKSNIDRRSALTATNSPSRSRPRHTNAYSNESSRSPAARTNLPDAGKITFTPLDWETDSLSGLLEHTTKRNGFDILLACDCIYNDALIAPFVHTCADIARLRPSLAAYKNEHESYATKECEEPLKPTVCIIAQQLRSHEVFECWLREALEEFVVWRVKDQVLGAGLGTGSGYVVHALVMRNS